MEQTNFILGLNTIPKLGNENRDVNGWFTLMETWLSLGGVTQDDLKLLWCKTTVVGDVLEFVKNQCEENENLTLVQMKDALDEYYGNKVNQQALKDEILSLSIRYGETVKDYNLRFKKLFNKLNRGARESVQVSDYIRTLKPRRKVWEGLVVKDFTNLEEAYKLAEKYDKVYEHQKYRS